MAPVGLCPQGNLVSLSSADTLSRALLVWGRTAIVSDVQDGAGQGSEGRAPCCLTLMVEGGPCCKGCCEGFSVCRSQKAWPYLLGLSAATLEWTPRTCVATPTLELQGKGVHMKRSLGCPEAL